MSSATIPQLLQQAVDHYNAGRPADAEALYRQILSIDPNHADALHLLGVTLFRQGRTDQAVPLIGKALSINPGAADYWNNIAAILTHSGQYPQAITSAKQAIELKRDYAEAYYTLSRALAGQHDVDGAVQACHQAIKLKPVFPEALNNLGNLLHHQKRLPEAIAVYQKAISQRPAYADAYSNLSVTVLASGRPSEAAAAAQEAIRLNPKHAPAWNNLSNASHDLNQLDTALTAADRARALKPSGVAHSNRANALVALQRMDEAVEAYRQSILQEPNNAKAHLNLGALYFNLGLLDDALSCYDRAAHLNPQDVIAQSNRLFTLQFHPGYDTAAQLREQKEFNDRFAKPLLSTIRFYTNPRTHNRRLRIGYLAADFRQHVLTFIMLPIFKCHDRDSFEITAYANLTRPDAMTEQVKSRVDRWRPIAGMNDQAVAELIRTDQIDILVDLTMHMAGGRPLVMARKPAPVQVAYCAYPGGTGLDAIDYRLTDPYLDPPGTDGNYVERSVRLPDSFWCYDPWADEIPINPLPALQNGYVTFGCLNGLNKVNSRTLSLWSGVLQALPTSRLLLLSPAGATRDRLRGAIQAIGVAPERVEFVDRAPHDRYLQYYNRIDLSLDTLPYNGHTTSLDSLWMGVPVVTLIGETVVGRAGWSQLSNLGLSELAALREKDFTVIATRLASDLDHLAELRRTLRPRMQASPLMNAPRFTQHLENAFRTLWRAYCDR